MVNRGGLRVFVHPMTNDINGQPRDEPLWMGEPLPVNVAFLRRVVERAPARRVMHEPQKTTNTP